MENNIEFEVNFFHIVINKRREIENNIMLIGYIFKRDEIRIAPFSLKISSMSPQIYGFNQTFLILLLISVTTGVDGESGE